MGINVEAIICFNLKRIHGFEVGPDLSLIELCPASGCSTFRLLVFIVIKEENES